MASHQELIKVTKSWIADFVISYGLCPFAKQPFDDGLIAYAVSSATADQDILASLWDSCSQMLDIDTARISNMFLLLPSINTFDRLLAVEDLCIGFMMESTLDTVFQLVAFHPDFRFGGEPEDAAGHYVNRSPTPMLHILRVAEVAEATAALANADDIPDRNKALLEQLGSDTLAATLHKYIR